MVLERSQPDDGLQGDAILLVNLSKKDKESVALLHHLLSTVRDSYEQLSDWQLLPVRLPLPDLELWNYWLAAELVAKWRDRSSEQIFVGTILDRLGLIKTENTYPIVTVLDGVDRGMPISQELVADVTAIGKNVYRQVPDANFRKWIEQKAAELAREFTQERISANKGNNVRARLQLNVEMVRSQHALQLQEFFNSLQQSGSRSVLRLLQTLMTILQRLAEESEAHKQEFLQKAMAAQRAYNSLSARIEPHNQQFGRRQIDWEAVLEALAKLYHFKFNAEIYDRVGLLVSELMRQTSERAISIAKTDEFLANLQNWFSQQCDKEPVFAPILKQYLEQRVDILNLLSEIEVKVNCPIQEWHSLNWTQTELLRKEISSQLNPACVEVYVECYQYLLELDRTKMSTKIS
jgi:hypothetical protein